MIDKLAYIGPGGPEFFMVMLVLLVLFGSKDAPRMLRKLNEIINQFRNTANTFKHEIMYSDINLDSEDSFDELIEENLDDDLVADDCNDEYADPSEPTIKPTEEEKTLQAKPGNRPSDNAQ